MSKAFFVMERPRVGTPQSLDMGLRESAGELRMWEWEIREIREIVSTAARVYIHPTRPSSLKGEHRNVSRFYTDVEDCEDSGSGHGSTFGGVGGMVRVGAARTD